MNLNKGARLVVCLFVCFLFARPPACSQQGFRLPTNKKRDVVPFELVNNLVIVPVTLNGTKLSFLLDTGVDTTVLFSIDEIDTLKLRSSQKIKIKGLGAESAIDAYLSRNNVLEVGLARDNDHGLYMVVSKEINFSRRMGIPVHGILGYDFFSRFVVDINYQRKKVTFYAPDKYSERSCRKCTEILLSFFRNKPYVSAAVGDGNEEQQALLLLDSGSSDGLWLFDEQGFIREEPVNYFRDFLGLGLSGRIFGKRTKIPFFELSDFKLTGVGTSIPDSEYVSGTRTLSSRDGSIGGAILKRFRLVLDYGNSRILLKPNTFFSDPFYYNMSGLVLEHDGLVPIREVAYFNINPVRMAAARKEASGIFDVYKAPTLEFLLAKRYVVAEIREGSVAKKAGVKRGDEVVSINGRPAYKYKLYELNELFSSREGRVINLKIKRNGAFLKMKFRLEKIL